MGHKGHKKSKGGWGRERYIHVQLQGQSGKRDRVPARSFNKRRCLHFEDGSGTCEIAGRKCRDTFSHGGCRPVVEGREPTPRPIGTQVDDPGFGRRGW